MASPQWSFVRIGPLIASAYLPPCGPAPVLCVPVRSKGYCWIDTDLRVAHAWQQAGPNLQIMPASLWAANGVTPGAEIVLIGIDFDHEATLQAFRDALLSDAEVAALIPS